MYFPDKYSDENSKNYYDILKKLLILQAEVIFDSTKEEQINKLYGELLEINKPAILTPTNSENIIFSNEIAIEKLYFSLEEQGIKNPRQMTVFQFEVALKKNEEEFERLSRQIDANK